MASDGLSRIFLAMIVLMSPGLWTTTGWRQFGIGIFCWLMTILYVTGVGKNSSR